MKKKNKQRNEPVVKCTTDMNCHLRSGNMYPKTRGTIGLMTKWPRARYDTGTDPFAPVNLSSSGRVHSGRHAEATPCCVVRVHDPGLML